MDNLQALVNKLPNKPMLLANTSYPFVQAIVSQEALILVLVIIICYITGLIFSEKHRFKREDKQDSEEQEIVSEDQQNEQEFFDVYAENKKLVTFINEKLHSQMKVDWKSVVNKDKWIVYYRWANMLSPNSTDRSNLQLMIAKPSYIARLFRLLSWLVLIPVLLAFAGDILQLNVTLESSAYYLPGCRRGDISDV
ncbi:hypothetical protein AMQ84_29840 [Paenibacillus riograndensis]|uniref:Uncharacterized protein n=2 Tax=Paenibacillus riograndensis TaxID=483937 RepID=A0A132TG31_9BACL|nr:hypothetical protein AMQ84_29840 [Paenibacillus riograndensis]